MLWIIIVGILAAISLVVGIVGIVRYKSLSEKIDSSDSNINSQSQALSSLKSNISDLSSTSIINAIVSFTSVGNDGTETIQIPTTNVQRSTIMLRRMGNIVYMFTYANLTGKCTQKDGSGVSTTGLNCVGGGDSTGIYVDLLTSDKKSQIIPEPFRPKDMNIFSVPAFFHMLSDKPGYSTTRTCTLQVKPDGSIRYGRGGNPVEPFINDTIHIWGSTVSWVLSYN